MQRSRIVNHIRKILTIQDFRGKHNTKKVEDIQVRTTWNFQRLKNKIAEKISEFEDTEKETNMKHREKKTLKKRETQS